MMKVVILAGGLGTRLRPYTFFVPKPMLPLGEKPLLEHILLLLKEQGFDDIVITVSYLKKVIEDYFSDGKEIGVKIQYAESPRPMGTAGQLKTAEKFVEDSFLLLYGDSLVDTDFRKLVQYHREKKGIATILLMPYRETLRYGFIESDSEGRLLEWREKPAVEGWINVGCYVMEKKFMNYIPDNVMFGMDEAFRDASRKGEQIFTFKAEGDFIDIGDKKSYREAYERYLKKLGKIK
jgi:mannose-1-phosphate guanylyltransferase